MVDSAPTSPDTDECQPRVSGPSLLAGGVLAGALGGCAANPRRRKVPVPSGAVPMASNLSPSRGTGQADGDDVAPSLPLEHRLAHRATMGMTGEDLRLIQSLGYQDYLAYQLDHQAIDDSACLARLDGLKSLAMTSWDIFQLRETLPTHELITAAFVRSVFSRRQLFERLVHFWTDHFNIDITQDSCQWLKTVDDREVIRKHALGNVPDIVRASATSPAMLLYLDNYNSKKGNPNENYARELLELPTLGVDNGYTQKDIVEVARCFTGWTYQSTKAYHWGMFEFLPDFHDFGQKRVLGFTIPAGGGVEDGLKVLHILTKEPRFARMTAAFIGRKLARWFWGYQPPKNLVDSVIETYMGTGGNIRAMVRTILQPEWMLTATPKFKRPFHLVVSSFRAVSVDQIRNDRGLVPIMKGAGHLPFHWQTPDGYPDDLAHWSGLLLPRINFSASLLDGRIKGVKFKLEDFLNGAKDSAQIVARLDDALFAGHMDKQDRSALTRYMQPDPPDRARVRDAIALALASPGFQWY